MVAMMESGHDHIKADISQGYRAVGCQGESGENQEVAF